MYERDNDNLRKVVNAHLGPKTAEASKPDFEKAKTELVFTKTALTKAINLLTMEKYLEIVDREVVADESDEKRAAGLVDSYFIPLPSETINGAFARAKRESIAKLRSEVAQLKYFSFKDYTFKKKPKRKLPTKKKRTTNFDNVRVERRRSSPK